LTGAGHRQEDVHRVARLLELADLLTPWAIRTVSTLRIPELLGDGAMTIQELAASSGTHPEALGKLLRFLIQHELFVEDPCGVFSLGSLGRLLAAEGRLPLRMVLDLDGAQTRFGQAGAGLAHAVRTGEAAYPSVFDRAFWDDLSDNPALGDSFDGLMAASAARWVPRALAEIEWDGVEHVVDIGGGSGALIVGLLQEQPGIRATLVEQPAVAEKARRRFAEAGLAGRTNVCSGSFFGPLPPGADLYVLAQILHDWPDDRAVAILRRCRDAIPTSGRVVLVERVLGQGGDRRAHAEMDLLMMVLFGASERGPEQFAELAAAAGLSLARITPLGHGVSLLELVVSDESVRTDPAIDACPTGVEMTESRPISPPSQKSDQPDDATWRQRVAARQRRQLDGPVAHPVCPDGWRVGPPDYVGIGAQKCGTTWWALLIGAHPGTSARLMYGPTTSTSRAPMERSPESGHPATCTIRGRRHGCAAPRRTPVCWSCCVTRWPGTCPG